MGAAVLRMRFAVEVCQVAFEQLPVELVDVLDADRGQKL